MNLIKACEDILDQLGDVVHTIKEEDYQKKVGTLNNATLGQHIRHTLEFFTCLKDNFDKGCINYDKRDHDRVIETDKTIAAVLINDLKKFFNKNIQDRDLTLAVNYSLNDEELNVIPTNYFRELAYNIEHAIHHMAIMKIGLKEIAAYVELPAHFGVAISTVKFQKTIADNS